MFDVNCFVLSILIQRLRPLSYMQGREEFKDEIAQNHPVNPPQNKEHNRFNGYQDLNGQTKELTNLYDRIMKVATNIYIFTRTEDEENGTNDLRNFL